MDTKGRGYDEKGSQESEARMRTEKRRCEDWPQKNAENTEGERNMESTPKAFRAVSQKGDKRGSV